MKTFFKLILAVLIINASARAGFASVQYFQFKEAAQQAILFGGGTPTVEVKRLILQRAQELDVPVQPDQVLVHRQGGRTRADASYRRVVELFPNQPYPWAFSFSVESYSAVSGPP